MITLITITEPGLRTDLLDKNMKTAGATFQVLAEPCKRGVEYKGDAYNRLIHAPHIVGDIILWVDNDTLMPDNWACVVENQFKADQNMVGFSWQVWDQTREYRLNKPWDENNWPEIEREIKEGDWIYWPGGDPNGEYDMRFNYDVRSITTMVFAVGRAWALRQPYILTPKVSYYQDRDLARRIKEKKWWWGLLQTKHRPRHLGAYQPLPEV